MDVLRMPDARETLIFRLFDTLNMYSGFQRDLFHWVSLESLTDFRLLVQPLRRTPWTRREAF